ncbi:MAG: DUF4388 domain-containing protein [Thermoanaerobaculia bacterium]
MSITGNLKTMELAELLQWLSGSRKTGTLVVENGKVTKQIFFRDGMIVSSASTDPKEHLGAFLVSHGFITDAELGQAIRMQESNKMLLGKILSTIGAISEQDVHRMLRLKAEESIYDVFSWSEGDFRFLDQKLPSASMVPIAIDVTGLVLEGMQRFDEWKRIREMIPSSSAIPVAIAAFDEKVFTEGAPQILSLIDDDRTVAEICKLTHSSEFHVCRILFRQVQARRLKIVKGRGPAAPEPAASAAEAAPPQGISPDSLMLVAHQSLQKNEFEIALRHMRAARALDPDSRKLVGEAQKIEDQIRAAVEKSGVLPTSVPVLARTMEELTQLKISSQEGFLLTRLNGAYDLKSIVNISSMNALDVQLAVWKLLKAGHIRLEK